MKAEEQRLYTWICLTMLFSFLTGPSVTIVHTIETVVPFVHLALQLCEVRKKGSFLGDRERLWSLVAKDKPSLHSTESALCVFSTR